MGFLVPGQPKKHNFLTFLENMRIACIGTTYKVEISLIKFHISNWQHENCLYRDNPKIEISLDWISHFQLITWELLVQGQPQTILGGAWVGVTFFCWNNLGNAVQILELAMNMFVLHDGFIREKAAACIWKSEES